MADTKCCSKCYYNSKAGCARQIMRGVSDKFVSRMGAHKNCFKPLPEPPKEDLADEIP